MIPNRYLYDVERKNQEGILRSEEESHSNLKLFDTSQISV